MTSRRSLARFRLPRRLLRRTDGRVERRAQPFQPAGDQVAVQVDGVRDLAVAQDELQLGELGAGVRQQQAGGRVEGRGT